MVPACLRSGGGSAAAAACLEHEALDHPVEDAAAEASMARGSAE
jgi:hypothetical protein